MLSKTKTFFTACAVACLTSAGIADFYNPASTDWDSSDGFTQGWGWESFSQPNSAPNFADAGWYGDPGFGYGAELYNFSGTATLAGTGNIYDPGGALNIHIYGDGDIDQALLQVSTEGSGLNWMDVQLYVDGTAGEMYMNWDSMEETFYQEIPGFGAIDQAAMSWDITDSYNGTVETWGFFISAYGPHASLDAVSLDTLTMTVPAPGAIAILGLAGMTARRRRK